MRKIRETPGKSFTGTLIHDIRSFRGELESIRSQIPDGHVERSEAKGNALFDRIVALEPKSRSINNRLTILGGLICLLSAPFALACDMPKVFTLIERIISAAIAIPLVGFALATLITVESLKHKIFLLRERFFGPLKASFDFTKRRDNETREDLH